MVVLGRAERGGVNSVCQGFNKRQAVHQAKATSKHASCVALPYGAGSCSCMCVPLHFCYSLFCNQKLLLLPGESNNYPPVLYTKMPKTNTHQAHRHPSPSADTCSAPLLALLYGRTL